jgi:ribose transport system permease protein
MDEPTNDNVEAGPAGGPHISYVRMLVSQFLSDYGMLAVLVLLVVFFSVVTFERRKPVGAEAAESVAAQIASDSGSGARVLVVARPGVQDALFAARLEQLLQAKGIAVAGRAVGEPREIRLALEERVRAGAPVDVIATTERNTLIVEKIQSQVGGLGATRVVVPQSSGGIDLSVGSLIALSAVITGTLIGKMGGANASVTSMVIGAAGAIATCGIVGLLSGLMVARFKMPPFIATLGMMLVASGVAYIVSGGESIYQIPDGFVWLGRGTAILGIPNAVILMVLLYAVANVVMSRMTLGRYIYAVGGNEEAARLSGVGVAAVLLLVYGLSGIMAGLGGVVLSSQLKSGAPTYGLLY